LKHLIKKIISKLPDNIKLELKRVYHRLQLKFNSFSTDEEEYELIGDFVTEGDWVIDIGANVGHYTKKMSDIVKNSGRVISFEPIKETFSILSSNTLEYKYDNVSLFNCALSDKMKIVNMSIPKYDSGLNDYYRAQINNDMDGKSILTISVDDLNFCNRIKLIKIDAEGEELNILKGMTELLKKYHPVLIIEDNDAAIIDYLGKLEYKARRIKDSHNLIFE